MDETIAASLAARAFSRELLPALGRPTIATLTPVLINSPLLGVCSTEAQWAGFKTPGCQGMSHLELFGGSFITEQPQQFGCQDKRAPLQ